MVVLVFLFYFLNFVYIINFMMTCARHMFNSYTEICTKVQFSSDRQTIIAI